MDEASETIVVNMEEGLAVPGRLESGKLSRAIDPDKMSDPRVSKVYRVNNADKMSSSQGVFVRTPKGDQVLDYNNPEVLKWLRQAEVPQRQSLESLIKNGAKESLEIVDFDLVLH